jgi:N-acetylglucosamine kinase-like BadF-type ATPase
VKYAAGVDGGGTKTEVMIVDEQGREAAVFTTGAVNYNGTDDISVRRSFEEIIQGIARSCGGLDRCVSICIGAAGVSNPAAVQRMQSVVRKCGYKGPLRITGDHEAALYGAHERAFGIILIAGTGSICYGRNEAGEAHRTGGFGYLIDDEGSGYSIGRDLLAAVVRACDGRIAPTLITDLVFERLQIRSVQDLVQFVHDRNTNKKDIAALAPLLSLACSQGDPEAKRIVDKNARALVELVMPVMKRLHLEQGELAAAGGVLLHNEYVYGAFREELKRRAPKLRCIRPKRSASAGAAMLAWDHFKAAASLEKN